LQSILACQRALPRPSRALPRPVKAKRTKTWTFEQKNFCLLAGSVKGFKNWFTTEQNFDEQNDLSELYYFSGGHMTCIRVARFFSV
jgi:hypothetical protein